MGKFRTLLLAHHAGNNHTTQVAVKQFSENVNRRTGGQIAIASVPDSALGNLPELFRMVVDGQADMALPPHDRLSGVSHKFGCVDMPFVFDDYAHAHRVIDNEFKHWIAPDLEALGVVYLAGWEWGFRQMTNTIRPVLSPEDLRGLRIRIPPIRNLHATLISFGATPVIVEFKRLFTAIQKGLVDGQENPIAIIHTMALWKTQRYLSLLNYSYDTIIHIINKSCLESLPAEHRTILHEESARAAETMRHLIQTQETEQLAQLAREGMRIDRPNPLPFKEASAPARQKITDYLGEETVQAFFKMVERQRRPGAISLP